MDGAVPKRRLLATSCRQSSLRARSERAHSGLLAFKFLWLAVSEDLENCADSEGIGLSRLGSRRSSSLYRRALLGWEEAQG